VAGLTGLYGCIVGITLIYICSRLVYYVCMLKSSKNLAHLIRIARILAKNDALFPVEMLNIPSLNLFVRIVRRRRKHLTPGQRLAKAFQELGPSFIKLGQALSTRSDLVGEDIAADLTMLRDQLPPFPVAKVKEIILAELHDSVNNLFLEFDDVPAAAASIAQVHFARTRDNEEVAVKILRPNIEVEIAKDIALFYWIARMIEKRNPIYAKRMRPVEVVQTLENTVKIELDLRMEAAAASELRENFRNWPGFYVPKIYWKFVSKRVLVIEKVSGVKIDRREEIAKLGLNPDEILATSSKALFKQVFDDGFFHADLHPGNVFVNARGEIVPIDFGIMGRIDRQSRIYIADILAGFLMRDYHKVAKAHFDAGYVPDDKSLDNFAMACRAVGEPIMDLPINEISVARLLAQMFSVAEEFEMITQPHLLLLQKTMMMAEGVGRALNPNVNMWKLAEPLVREWAAKNMGVKAQIKNRLGEAREFLQQLPRLIDLLELYLREKV